MDKFIKYFGLVLAGLAFILNPWVIEYFFSPDKKLDFLWKYFVILFFDLGLLILGLSFYLWLHKKSKEVLLSMGTILFALVLAEGFFYLADPHFAKQYAVLHDKELGWILNPAFSYDSYLLERNEYYISNLDSDSLVYVIGDSYVQGKVKKEIAPFTEYVKKAFPSQNIINLGVWGYNVNQYLAVAKKYSSIKKPRYVLLNFFVGNDFVAKEKNEPQMKNLFLEVGLIENMNHKSYLVKNILQFKNLQQFAYLEKNNLLYTEKRSHAETIYSINNFFNVRAVDETLKIFDELITFLKQNNIKIFIIIAPSDYQVHPTLLDNTIKGTGITPDYSNLIKAQQFLISYLEKNSIEYIDLLPIFQEKADNEFLYNQYENHWNNKGNVLAAQAIVAKIKEINFLNNE